MRELHECQAEVFRRSEKRIKKRKQRTKHILTACIPLALCISVFSAVVLPEIMSQRAEDPAAPETALAGMGQSFSQSIAAPISEITVSGHGFSRSYTDADQVLQITTYLHACAQESADSNGAPEDGVMRGEKKEHADIVYECVTDSAGTGYTLTLITDAGQSSTYYLLDHTLTNLTSHQLYPLSHQQVNELEDLLGIPHA